MLDQNLSKWYNQKSEQRCKFLMQTPGFCHIKEQMKSDMVTSNLFNKFTFKSRLISHSSPFEADLILFRIVHGFEADRILLQNGKWLWNRLRFFVANLIRKVSVSLNVTWHLKNTRLPWRHKVLNLLVLKTFNACTKVNVT